MTELVCTLKVCRPVLDALKSLRHQHFPHDREETLDTVLHRLLNLKVGP